MFGGLRLTTRQGSLGLLVLGFAGCVVGDLGLLGLEGGLEQGVGHVGGEALDDDHVGAPAFDDVAGPAPHRVAAVGVRLGLGGGGGQLVALEGAVAVGELDRVGFA